MSRTEEKKARARAAWRAWYRRHLKEAKLYYRKRYVTRLKNETVIAREIRLAQARKTQKKYASRIKKKKR